MSIAPLISSVGQIAPSPFRPEITSPVPGKIGGGLPESTFENALANQMLRQTHSVLHPGQPTPGTSATGGHFISNAIGQVQEMQNQATSATQRVLQGDGAALHQSMIAMEEASVSFQLLVEMRNKVVETLQELMRMQI